MMFLAEQVFIFPLLVTDPEHSKNENENIECIKLYPAIRNQRQEQLQTYVYFVCRLI